MIIFQQFLTFPRLGNLWRTRNRKEASSITASWLRLEKPLTTSGKSHGSSLKSPKIFNFFFNPSKPKLVKVALQSVKQFRQRKRKAVPLFLLISRTAGKHRQEQCGFIMASSDLPPIMLDHLYSMDENLKVGGPLLLLEDARENPVVGGEPLPKTALIVEPASISRCCIEKGLFLAVPLFFQGLVRVG
ncbi:unnamed protein product [Prunus armeniaca]